MYRRADDWKSLRLPPQTSKAARGGLFFRGSPCWGPEGGERQATHAKLHDLSLVAGKIKGEGGNFICGAGGEPGRITCRFIHGRAPRYIRSKTYAVQKKKRALENRPRSFYQIDGSTLLWRKETEKRHSWKKIIAGEGAAAIGSRRPLSQKPPGKVRLEASPGALHIPAPSGIFLGRARGPKRTPLYGRK